MQRHNRVAPDITDAAGDQGCHRRFTAKSLVEAGRFSAPDHGTAPVGSIWPASFGRIESDASSPNAAKLTQPQRACHAGEWSPIAESEYASWGCHNAVRPTGSSATLSGCPDGCGVPSCTPKGANPWSVTANHSLAVGVSRYCCAALPSVGSCSCWPPRHVPASRPRRPPFLRPHRRHQPTPFRRRRRTRRSSRKLRPPPRARPLPRRRPPRVHR